MSENKASFVPGSKIKASPTKRTVKRFFDRGGYALLESSGEGKTPAEKQMNGWKRHGIFAELAEKTKLGRPTLYRIASWFPTCESSDMPKMLWITQDEVSPLNTVNLGLRDTERLLKEVQKYFERSFIIDSMEFRVRQQICGETMEEFQQRLRKRLEADEKPQELMETIFKDALTKLGKAIWDLQHVISGIDDKLR